MVWSKGSHVKITIIDLLDRLDIIREKTDEIHLDQQKMIQLLNEKLARVQKDAENMAADFQKEREWLERQELQAGSNGGGRSNFAARAAKFANVALQVGAGVAGVVYMYGKFLSPVPLPPPPPPGVAAQVLTAVVSLFKHIHWVTSKQREKRAIHNTQFV